MSAPYDWALEQMRVPEAHAVTRGSQDVIVAVIDIAYHYHPDHAGHLWVNPRPLRGDVYGWDFDQEDATLEYEGPPYDATKHYFPRPWGFSRGRDRRGSARLSHHDAAGRL